MDNNIFDYEMAPRRRCAADYRAEARKKLRGKWGIAVLAMLLASILGAITSIAAVENGMSFDFSQDMTEEELVITQEELLNTPPQVIWEKVRAFFEDTLFGTFLIVELIIGALFSLALAVFVGSPVTLGYQRFHLALADEEAPPIKGLFSYFQTAYFKSILLRLLHGVIVTVIPLVGTLLCGLIGYAILAPQWLSLVQAANIQTFLVGLIQAVLPVVLLSILIMGVAIALNVFVSYRYVFCYMILAEYPQMSVIDAIRNSARLMQGNKWRLFCLNISFIGWYLLGAMACGIGLLWVIPYVNAAQTEFYSDIANRSAAKYVDFPSLDPEDYYPGAEL